MSTRRGIRRPAVSGGCLVRLATSTGRTRGRPTSIACRGECRLGLSTPLTPARGRKTMWATRSPRATDLRWWWGAPLVEGSR